MRAFYVSLMFICIACTKPNPNRCCTDEADCNAKGIPVGSVCDVGLVCRGNQCISEPCTSAAACDEAAPYCVAELCSETCAEDAHCPGFAQDPRSIFCMAGTCVECRDAADCPSTAPVCNAGSCRGCNADSDCASGVCDNDEAKCIAEASVVYVAPSGSTTSNCTRADPCTLARAFTVADANRPAIKLGSGSNSMGGTGPIGSKAVTIYGPGNVSGDGGPLDSATLRLRDVVWTGSPGCMNSATNMPKPVLDLKRVDLAASNIVVDTCDAIIRDSKIRSTASPGTQIPLISTNGEFAGINGATTNRGSTVTIERTVLDGGDPAIDSIRFSTVQISNSIFKNQGTSSGWIRTGNNSGTGAVRFSTFYKSVLKCAVVAGNGFLESSNNIFFNVVSGAPADTATGTYCSHTYDLVIPQATSLAGSGNKLAVDPRFLNASGGDFHLMANSPAIDAADPASTQATDFDGTARPQGAARDMGAFEYH
jgi:hypothetical protein